MGVGAAENDPVEDPTGYRELVLSYLGEDDPAGVQAATPEALQTLVRAAGDRLTRRPEPGEWSVLEVISHIIHAEIVSSFRYRAILSEDGPRIAPYDQDPWVDALPIPESDVDTELRMFAALRAANLAMWARSTPEERARIGNHEERGPESYDLSFRLISGHDRLHVEQARSTLERLDG